MKKILIIFVSILFISMEMIGNTSEDFNNFRNNTSSDSSALRHLIINEIMYNDGGTTDSLEFIEIINNSTDSVSLKDVILKGRTISFQFPDKKLKPGGLTVVCNNNEAFHKYFKFYTYQWSTGGLNNKLDSLVLLSPAGDTLDKVFYQEDDLWPSLADGHGYSLSLCDPAKDNNKGLNWQAASVYAGFKYLGNEMHANPGKANYCSVDIQNLKQTNGNGELENKNKLVYVDGSVCGANFNPAGLQFSIINHNDEGVWIYSTKKFGYSFHQGDKVALWGKFEDFNSLGQISLDSIVLQQVDTFVIEPKVIQNFTEEDEGNLIKLNNVRVINFSQWTSTGSGFNVDVSNSVDTFTLRIDKDTDIFNKQAPSGTFSVTGILGQYDKTSPFFDGYQLYPRYTKDIDPYNTDSYPLKSIKQVKENDENGNAKLKALACEVRGIVYGINLRPNGLQFTIIDNDNYGVGVYSSTKKYGYTVKEGDLIAVRGKVDQYSGLTQMAVDTVILLSQQNTLLQPLIVTELDENTESQLIKILGLSLKNPSEWKGTGESVNITLTDGTKDYQMRIDNDCDLSTKPAPDYKFNLTGIGGQFDSTSPYLDGYQIFPRYSQDLEKTSSYSIVPEMIFIYPNPVESRLFIEDSDKIELEGAITDMTGKTLMTGLKGNSIDMRHLPTGIYIAKFITTKGIRSLKIVKK